MAGDICNLPLFFIKKQTCKGIPYILHATVKRIKSLVDDKKQRKTQKLRAVWHWSHRAEGCRGYRVASYRLSCGAARRRQQIGAQVAEGKIDAIVFLCDPLTVHPHDLDVRVLLRIAVVYDVPIATNISTADCIIKKPFPMICTPKVGQTFGGAYFNVKRKEV